MMIVFATIFGLFWNWLLFYTVAWIIGWFAGRGFCKTIKKMQWRNQSRWLLQTIPLKIILPVALHHNIITIKMFGSNYIIGAISCL